MNNSWIYKVLNIIGIGLIVTAGVIAIQIYYNEMHGECIADPLVYAAQGYEERTGYAFQGSGSFLIQGGNSPIVYFDSHGVSVKNPSEGTPTLLDLPM